MPKVGDKHYGYDKKGIAQAKKDAAKKGLPLQMRKLSAGKKKDK